MSKQMKLNAIEFRYLRLSLGLDLEQVAELAKATVADVIAWETGELELPGLVQKALVDFDETIEMQVVNTTDGIEALFKKEKKRPLAFVVYPTQALYQQYNANFVPSLPYAELYNMSALRIKKECDLMDVEVTLVPLNVESYKAFREANGLSESVESRSKWAAAQL